MGVEPFRRSTSGFINDRSGQFGSVAKSESPVPDIAVVPPTPEYNCITKNVSDCLFFIFNNYDITFLMFFFSI